MRIKLPSVAAICDHTGISDRAAAAIASAALQDLGIITGEDKTNASEAPSNSKLDKLVDFPQLPCYKQAVERSVKLVTESAQNICGSIPIEGYIRAKRDSQEKKVYCVKELESYVCYNQKI
ncbi:unnamed protein product [Brassicogethes aeneus]|uniref:Uncharacterized protein n=1 Tax=Brassicogethes aeneus TaxID=1431903 RepID=A0A9P0BDA6_BRAAE|nr:unnamed protein product [Brassicogethes aeneus]